MRLLDNVSKDAHVNYYRCPACGHVWQEPKSGVSGQSGNITPSRKEA